MYIHKHCPESEVRYDRTSRYIYSLSYTQRASVRDSTDIAFLTDRVDHARDSGRDTGDKCGEEVEPENLE